MSNKVFIPLMAIVLGVSALGVRFARADDKPTTNTTNTRVFELRRYTANPGKLDTLLARFRDHTNAIFEKHGMTIIGFWVPTDEKLSKNTLIYILAFPSKEAKEKAWKEFHADPDWQKVKADSEKDGPLLVKNGVESHLMSPTDFSPIR